ncbi:DUF1269 domain-containing protein [Streptacidiphilus sp. PB12-B1b]|uniref:DUF1269 domain-containing protein n=1 Tax=Streptacidiphilus sp. PB12-B1b TaxID=2705012 RepID=UPI0015F91ACF|nr:DUF1269 domain-containing protein [Streptacidiphilus sp. PB12-B1b]QMU79447.1 DUF1269 domain-containing protein [Streptacidiphilus sp. PB12-B1b]
MSNLIAVAYPDVATAEKVRALLGDLQKQKLIQVEDAVVVERREDGKVKLHQAVSTTGVGAAGGALWGGLIGLIFLMPFLGAAIGGAAGAAVGSAQDYGVDNDFMRRVGEHLTPGAAALFVLVQQSVPEKVIPQVAPFGGQLIQTSLSDEAEAHLREAVRAAQS